jgi:hypothetical protein
MSLQQRVCGAEFGQNFVVSHGRFGLLSIKSPASDERVSGTKIIVLQNSVRDA